TPSDPCALSSLARVFTLTTRLPPRSTLFPYTTLFRSSTGGATITLTFEMGTDADIAQVQVQNKLARAQAILPEPVVRQGVAVSKDRKSTRLNSSHVKISYAVFCLKKKN